MYNVNDILARIQKGENPETIAHEFAKSINDAVALDKKQKAEAAAKAAAAQKEKELAALATSIAADMTKYIKLSSPEAAKLMDNDISAEDVKLTLDTSIKTIMTTAAMVSSLAPKASPKAATTADDAIEQFLKEIGF